MPSTMPAHAPASHREELASVRGRQAKAALEPQVPASSLRDLAAEAIRASHGKARAAAIDLGIHEASLSRQLKDGSLRLEQLETLGPATLAELGRQLTETFGPLSTPQARLRQIRREQRRLEHELDQLLEHIA
jgi:hypothetical protein